MKASVESFTLTNVGCVLCPALQNAQANGKSHPQLLMKLDLKIKVLKEKYFDVELLTIALFRGNNSAFHWVDFATEKHGKTRKNSFRAFPWHYKLTINNYYPIN